MWWILTIGLIVLFLANAYYRSPQSAIGLVVPIAFLFPAWLLLPLQSGPDGSIYGAGVDVKLLVGAACLILYCFMPGRTFPLRIVPCDIAVILLMLFHVLSDWLNDGLNWLVLGRAYAEWYLPYTAGRLAIQSRRNIEHLWITMAFLSLMLSGGAILEALTNINLFETLFGLRPVEGFSREASRWNLQRAYGPCMHPIYLGVVQLLLLSWTGLATWRSLQRKAAWPWVFSLVPCFLGIVATGSRGPIVGSILCCVTFVFYLVPRARWPMAGCILALALVGLANREAIVEQLEKWAGEARLQTIEVDDETLVQTGTRNRINIFGVYKIALKRSGLNGFGTQAVSGFPINVPLGPREVETIRQTKFVDNEYILITLRFGYLGLAAFTAVGLLALGQLWWLANLAPRQLPQQLACCLGAALFSSLLTLLTVWMPYEIGFVLFWTCGLSSGLLGSQLQGHQANRNRPKQVHRRASREQG